MDGFECGLEEAFDLLIDVFCINAGYTQHLSFLQFPGEIK